MDLIIHMITPDCMGTDFPVKMETTTIMNEVLAIQLKITMEINCLLFVSAAAWNK